MKKRTREGTATSFTRYLWIGIGCISFALGTIGIFLPILPTFPFYLLTLVCFTKGSERLSIWFTNSKFYKSTIEDFIKNKTLTGRAKVRILFSLSLMMLFAAYFMTSLYLRGLLAFIWIIHVVYLGFIVKTK